MLDLALLRTDPDRIRRSAVRRGISAAFVDTAVALDVRQRQAITTAEQLKAEKNGLTATISKAADRAAEAARLKPQIAALDARIAEASAELPACEEELRALLGDVPNVLDGSVPDGAGSEQNVVVRTWGTPRQIAAPKAHWELGEALGIIDFERAAKLSGSRFSILRGAGARLERAIASFFLDRAARNGYIEISPPVLVARSTMWATGQLSKFADQMFRDDDADLVL